jgi:hypothetical protein
MRIKLTENEKDQISSKHEEIDSGLFNFLVRRIKVEEKDLGTDWFDQKPLRVTEYRFEGFPGYGFNSFSSKKDMEYKIVEMLIEDENTDFVGDWFYGLQNVNNPERQKFIKTIRKFLNFVLTK